MVSNTGPACSEVCPKCWGVTESTRGGGAGYTGEGTFAGSRRMKQVCRSPGKERSVNVEGRGVRGRGVCTEAKAIIGPHAVEAR